MIETLLFLTALLSALLWEATSVALFGRIQKNKPRKIGRGVAVLVWIVALGWPLIAATRLRLNSNFSNTSYDFNFQLALFVSALIGIGILHLFSRRRKSRNLLPLPKWSRAPLAIALLAALSANISIYRIALHMRERQASEMAAAVYARFTNGLDRIPADQPDLNAAPLYAQAMAELGKTSPAGFKRIDEFQADKTSPDDPQVADYLHQFEPTSNLLRQAATRPACRFPEDDLYPQIDPLQFHLNSERNLAILLAANVRHAALIGDAARAVGDADTILRMSRHFALRPTVVAGLVGIGVHDIGLDALRQALQTVKSPSDLAPLDTDLLPLPTSAVQQALRGEAVYSLAMVLAITPDAGDQAINGPVDNPVTHTFDSQSVVSLTILDFAAIDQLYATYRELLPHPYYQIVAQIPDSRYFDRHGVLVSAMGPSMNGLIRVWNTSRANDLCALAGVAMTRYRLDNGALPNDLNDLIPRYLPAVPIDPFTGKPIRLIHRAGKSIVYSVGPNCVDDGGVFDPRSGRDDVVFELNN